MAEKMKQLQQGGGKELGEEEARGPRSHEAHVMIKSKKRKELNWAKGKRGKKGAELGKEMGHRESNRPTQREIKRSHVQCT